MPVIGATNSEKMQRAFLFACMFCTGAAFLYAAFWTLAFLFVVIATFSKQDVNGLWGLFGLVLAGGGSLAFGLATRRIWERLKRTAQMR